jgi:membrane dipeptidase
MDTIGDYPNLIAAMHRVGWTETRIRKIMGSNWFHLLETVWGE